MKNPKELTDAEKLSVVLKAVSYGPEISSPITHKLLFEIQQKGIHDLDSDMWGVLAKASKAMQNVFILGGLSMLLQSQEAVKAGWTPTTEDLDKLYPEDKKNPKPTEDPDVGTFFRAN